MRLPPVGPVKPTQSVSTTFGLTSSYVDAQRLGQLHATSEARVPPMSTQPSTSCTVPSALTLALELVSMPALPQKPIDDAAAAVLARAARSCSAGCSSSPP